MRQLIFLSGGILLGAGCGQTASNAQSPRPVSDTEKVGRGTPDRLVTPVNQIVTPLGKQVELAGLRPQVLALSPHGKFLATSGKTSALVIVSPDTGEILQKVALPSEKDREPTPDVSSPNILAPDKDGQLSYNGLIFSPDGRWIYLSNVDGSIKVFAVSPEGRVAPSHSIPLPPVQGLRRDEEIPSGLALSPDGSKLYVCCNLSNQLHEINLADGKVLRSFPVGVAPFEVLLHEGRAYVSNWGGRRPGKGDLTGPAGQGTVVRVDPVRHIANEGSVSVIPLGGGETREILTAPHASALALSPDRRWLVVANSGADNLSVIDTKTDTVAETIWVKPKPSDLLGATPTALAFDSKGKRLYVCNGTQNAIAVVAFDPSDKESKLLGLMPVGWFPSWVVFDAARGMLHVSNLKGHPPAPRAYKAAGAGEGAQGYNTHQYTGSLSLVPLPKEKSLPELSAKVALNLRADRIAEAFLPARPDQPARAVPERIGEPSLIKHVVYIIKENRTYDQVLGDVATGNGDPKLCIFGERFTPNQHKLVKEFALLDNTYCSGILSADGHNWTSSAFGNDYLERSFAGWPRSYPDGMGDNESDALAYSPAGFLWDNVRRGGLSQRNFGEFMIPRIKWADGRKGSPGAAACYKSWKDKTGEVTFASEPAVASLKDVSDPNYVGWSMSVPDQFRADRFLADLKQREASGDYPRMTYVCLPNDHTSGTSANCPTPAACVADNDLALGRIIEGLSHSKFWKETAVFVIEDDPQAGWDHVSGYRTTCYVAGPYVKRGATVSTQYNTTSLIRTMEQILGLRPMNQFDASATPMRDCFTDTPDPAPFVSVPNNIPLDQMNPGSRAEVNPQLRQDALASERMNFREVDKAPEDELNRILWRAMKGPNTPYPEWAVSSAVDDDDD